MTSSTIPLPMKTTLLNSMTSLIKVAKRSCYFHQTNYSLFNHSYYLFSENTIYMKRDVFRNYLLKKIIMKCENLYWMYVQVHKNKKSSREGGEGAGSL